MKVALKLEGMEKVMEVMEDRERNEEILQKGGLKAVVSRRTASSDLKDGKRAVWMAASWAVCVMHTNKHEE